MRNLNPVTNLTQFDGTDVDSVKAQWSVENFQHENKKKADIMPGIECGDGFPTSLTPAFRTKRPSLFDEANARLTAIS